MNEDLDLTIPVEITFHGMQGTDALRADIEKHAQKLGRFAPELINCRFVLERAEARHHRGNRFVARIRVTLPGGELDVGHAPSGDQSHEDAYVAIGDAFQALRRNLQDFRRKRQGKVKLHRGAKEGHVQYIDRQAGYGVIETPDGREIHFHPNSVVDAAFERIQVNDRVRFAEVPGEEGPWASTVHLITHHYGT